jgi:protein MpaA
MKEILLGKSVQGRDIKGYVLGDENLFNKTLIIGAIHGVEPQSKEFCEYYINEIKGKQFPEDCFLLLIPCINPDGIFHKTRGNANGVDLNRNFPSHTWNKVPVAGNSAYFPGSEPASEPETKIIVSLINKYNFKKVIAIHTNHFIRFPNPPMINYDGEQSRELAEKISNVTGLSSHEDIGYPTPGSMGIWIGKDLKKISVTIELDDTKKSDEHYKRHGKLFDVAVITM